MSSENKDLFAQFKKIHDAYSRDKFANQQAFNQHGAQVRRIMELWDSKLCGRMEGGLNATYSARLSEKFWQEIKQEFPLIDFVGVTIRRAQS